MIPQQLIDILIQKYMQSKGAGGSGPRAIPSMSAASPNPGGPPSAMSAGRPIPSMSAAGPAGLSGPSALPPLGPGMAGGAASGGMMGQARSLGPGGVPPGGPPPPPTGGAGFKPPMPPPPGGSPVDLPPTSSGLGAGMAAGASALGGELNAQAQGDKFKPPAPPPPPMGPEMTPQNEAVAAEAPQMAPPEVDPMLFNKTGVEDQSTQEQLPIPAASSIDPHILEQIMMSKQLPSSAPSTPIQHKGHNPFSKFLRAIVPGV